MAASRHRKSTYLNKTHHSVVAFDTNPHHDVFLPIIYWKKQLPRQTLKKLPICENRHILIPSPANFPWDLPSTFRSTHSLPGQGPEYMQSKSPRKMKKVHPHG